MNIRLIKQALLENGFTAFELTGNRLNICGEIVQIGENSLNTLSESWKFHDDREFFGGLFATGILETDPEVMTKIVLRYRLLESIHRYQN